MIWGKNRSFIKEHSKGIHFLFLAPLTLSLIDRFHLLTLFPDQVAYIQTRIGHVYGHRQTSAFTKMFISQLLCIHLISLVFGLVVTLYEGDIHYLLAGFVFAVVLPLLACKKLHKQAKQKQQLILIELPEFVNQLLLLIHAGSTVQQAFMHCVSQRKNDKDSPLYDELEESLKLLQNNESFSRVLEKVNKRFGMAEFSILTTTILLNYRKGGDDLVLALRDFSHQLWEKRKAQGRIRGEEASAKLVFPMILIFIAIMLMISWPALSLF